MSSPNHLHRIIHLLSNGRWLVSTVGLGLDQSFATREEALREALERISRLGGMMTEVNGGKPTVW